MNTNHMKEKIQEVKNHTDFLNIVITDENFDIDNLKLYVNEIKERLDSIVNEAKSRSTL